jgi:hypothetical protein
MKALKHMDANKNIPRFTLILGSTQARVEIRRTFMHTTCEPKSTTCVVYVEYYTCRPLLAYLGA